MGKLSGKVCLITGGARGQGAAEVALFADEGATAVFITDVRTEDGTRTAAETGAQFLQHDVSDAEQWQAVVRTVIEETGRLDVLINNAAIFEKIGLIDTTPEHWARFVGINQTSIFLGMRAVAPTMIAQRSGSIINLSSIAGLGGSKAFAYSATKWAVRGMTKSAALELGPLGVRVNAILPGVIDTEMIAGVPLDEAAVTVPLRRCGTAYDVAQLALWLASDASSYANGAEFVLDGGKTA